MDLWILNWWSGMKIHDCSCSFVFVYYYDETRVRLSPCSTFWKQKHVPVQFFRKFRVRLCSGNYERTNVFAPNVYDFVHPCLRSQKRFYNEFIGASIKIYMTASFHNLSPFNTFLIDSSMDNKVANGATNEKNCCKNISHMVQKNTADDQKQ